MVDFLIAGERWTCEDGHAWNPVEETVYVKYGHDRVNKIAGDGPLV